MYLSVTPAYGRDYKSKKEVLADWEAGKDFQLQPSGQYMSIRDATPGMVLNIRYKRLTQICVVRVK